MKKPDKNMTVAARVDPYLTIRFHEICEGDNLKASDAIRRFVDETVAEGRLPWQDENDIISVVLNERIEDLVEPRLKALEGAVENLKLQIENLI